MGTYRILSVDGGGVRGATAIRLLQRLSWEFPNILDRVDLLAGTSTGAFICACLAKGMSFDDVFELYVTQSKYIFHRSWLRFFGFQALAAKYSKQGMKDIVTQVFEDTTLGELRKNILISTLDLDAYDCNGKRSYKPKFFHNLECKDKNELDIRISEILMYSAAAPTFFPSHNGYVDGGLVANNPSVSAIAQALDPNTEPSPQLSDIRLLSIGCGKPTSYVAGTDHDWGFAQWSTKIIELMLNGAVEVADYECRQLLKGHYIRANPYLDEEFKMDSVSCIPRMIEAADAYDISSHIAWVESNF